MPRAIKSLDFHSINVHFSNAFFRESAQGALRLAAGVGESHWRTSRDIRRTLERWQTKTFIHTLMSSVGVGSVYGLEELMMRGWSELVFPLERPKICDRMARFGEPAIAKQFASGGRKDRRTERWIDRLIELDPEAVEVLRFPIWRLLDPQPLAHVEWHDLGYLHVKEAAKSECEQKVWMVTLESGDQHGESPYFIPCSEKHTTRFELTSLLLGLRRSELLGDLLAYDLYLQEVLAVVKDPRPHASLEVLQPEIAAFIAQVFGKVLVPYGPENVEAQRERVQGVRQAWQQRILLGDRTGFDK